MQMSGDHPHKRSMVAKMHEPDAAHAMSVTIQPRSTGEWSPLAMDEVKASLHLIESDVLDQWRTAVCAHDSTRIGELVQLAHSLRDMGNSLRIDGGPNDPSSNQPIGFE